MTRLWDENQGARQYAVFTQEEMEVKAYQRGWNSRMFRQVTRMMLEEDFATRGEYQAYVRGWVEASTEGRAS